MTLSRSTTIGWTLKSTIFPCRVSIRRFSPDQDGDPGAREIIDLHKVQGHARFRPALDQLVEGVTESDYCENRSGPRHCRSR